jgi:hypothetical protein
MGKFTGPEILEKWSHIAMRLFPPQMNVGCASANGTLAIRVRWKAGNDPDARGMRDVDLYFPQEMLADYVEADAEVQVKWDALIENAISEKLQNFDPHKGAGAEQQVERWLIVAGRPGA